MKYLEQLFETLAGWMETFEGDEKRKRQRKRRFLVFVVYLIFVIVMIYLICTQSHDM